jgi:hypothetical protein
MAWRENSRRISNGEDALAKSANVGVSTVRDFEAARREPTRNNLAATQAALEKGGVFIFRRLEGKRNKGSALDRKW